MFSSGPWRHARFGQLRAIRVFVNTESKPLRITVADGSSAVTMKLEGRIAGEAALEIDRAWSALAPSLGEKKLVIDLRDVTFMNETGIGVLGAIYGQCGAQFQANTPLTRYFAEEATKANQKRVSEGSF